MVQRRGISQAPCEYATGEWPAAPLSDHAPAAAHYARHIAVKLREALTATSVSQLARDADCNRSTVQGLIAGRFWPDLVTVAKLEVALGRSLWPPQPPTAS